jgi:hypothetical protein
MYLSGVETGMENIRKKMSLILQVHTMALFVLVVAVIGIAVLGTLALLFGTYATLTFGSAAWVSVWLLSLQFNSIKKPQCLESVGLQKKAIARRWKRQSNQAFF